MKDLVSLIKGEFNTIRELEKTGFTLFAYAGGAFVVGMICIFTTILAFIGIPLVIVGVVTFFLAMLWMSKLGKQPVWHVFCPYCSSKNDVFKTRPHFSCDICGRVIMVGANGDAQPTEPVEQHKAY